MAIGYLSKPAYACVHIGFHYPHDVAELHIVDVVDGVVGAEVPEVLLDSVVHKCLFELRPICLHHCQQFVLPGIEMVIQLSVTSSPNCCDDCDLPERVLNPVPRYRNHWLQLKLGVNLDWARDLCLYRIVFYCFNVSAGTKSPEQSRAESGPP